MKGVINLGNYDTQVADVNDIHKNAANKSPKAARECYLNSVKTEKPGARVAVAQLFLQGLGAAGRSWPYIESSIIELNNQKFYVWMQAIFDALNRKEYYHTFIECSRKFKLSSKHPDSNGYDYGNNSIMLFSFALELLFIEYAETRSFLALVQIAKHLFTFNNESSINFQFPDISVDDVEKFLKELEYQRLEEHLRRRLLYWITPNRIFQYLFKLETKKEPNIQESHPCLLALAREHKDDLEYHLNQSYPNRPTHKKLNFHGVKFDPQCLFDGSVLPLVFNYEASFFGNGGGLRLPGQTSQSRSLLWHFNLINDNGSLSGDVDKSFLGGIMQVKQNPKGVTGKGPAFGDAVDKDYCKQLIDLMNRYPKLFDHPNVVDFLIAKFMPSLLEISFVLDQKLHDYFVRHKDELRNYVLQEIRKNPNSANLYSMHNTKNAYSKIVDEFRRKPSFVPGCFYKRPLQTRTHQDITAAIAATQNNGASNMAVASQSRF